MTYLAHAHANYNDRWYTPMPWLDWISKELGGSWYDPCPAGWSDGDPDGLSGDWPSRYVYCNHPGSRKRGNAQAWWDKFHAERYPQPTKFVWCGFSLEQLRTLSPSPMACRGWLVLPSKRIAYVHSGTMEPAKSPAQSTFFWLDFQPKHPTPIESTIIRTGVTE